jgi:protein-ribulosamine 3-kinase
MFSAELLQSIADSVGAIDQAAIRSVGGGSINCSYKIPALDGTAYFLKTNHASALDMFQAERDGLREIEKADAIGVPRVINAAVTGDTAFLLMEYLDLRSTSVLAGSRLGSLLASQHRYKRTEYGWYRDNTIGRTPQLNGWDDDWIRFFREKRLRYQLDLAVAKGFDTGPGKTIRDRGEKLMQRLPDFFSGYQPEPSLLHGDLWGGNWGVILHDQPVIFDPAVYYGDRETDIAMTRLFGGFGPEFLAAYNEAWPLDTGFARRCDLYNLYHVLNHLNLFGEGYLRQVSDMLDRLLA